MAGKWRRGEPTGEMCGCKYELMLLNMQKQTICSHIVFQTSDTALEEFLEELDALTDTEAEDLKDRDLNMKVLSSPLSLSALEKASGSEAPASDASLREGSPAQGKTEASPPRGSEKKVRFSEELIQTAHMKQTTGSQDSVSFKASSPNKKQGPQQLDDSGKPDDSSPQDQGGGPSAPPVAQQQLSQIECTQTGNNPLAPSSPSTERACICAQESSVQPVELAKCNISSTNTGTRRDQCPRGFRRSCLLLHYKVDSVFVFFQRGTIRVWSVRPKPGVGRSTPSTLHQQW